MFGGEAMPNGAVKKIAAMAAAAALGRTPRARGAIRASSPTASDA